MTPVSIAFRQMMASITPEAPSVWPSIDFGALIVSFDAVSSPKMRLIASVSILSSSGMPGA